MKRFGDVVRRWTRGRTVIGGLGRRGGAADADVARGVGDGCAAATRGRWTIASDGFDRWRTPPVRWNVREISSSASTSGRDDRGKPRVGYKGKKLTTDEADAADGDKGGRGKEKPQPRVSRYRKFNVVGKGTVRAKRETKGKEEVRSLESPRAGGGVEVAEGSTLTAFAKELEMEVRDLEQVLANLGESLASSEDAVPTDVMELVGLELNVDIAVTPDLNADVKELVRRRGVVAVMGHVDHGKTTLLDSLRKTSVAAGEAGGITQHIGAFVVELPGGNGSLTFLDTPGHAAFSAMRQRGASATDVAVLVVAADDGVMPQTREAAAHIQAAGVPMVVALTKIDRENADPQRVKGEIVSMGIELEEFGGKVQCVPVSAIAGEGLRELEECLVLEAESLELMTSLTGKVDGVVLEAKLDKGQGPVATGLLKAGTLKVGSHVVVGNQYGRVRSLRNGAGDSLTHIGPAEPFELVGLKGVPSAGDSITMVHSESRAKRICEARAEREAALKSASAEPAPSQSEVNPEERGHLNVIVKADVQGTAEAVRDALLGLSTDAVGLKVVFMGVGAITESDLNLSAAIGAPVLGFNVREPPNSIAKMAKQKGVRIVRHRVIYHLLDEVGEMLTGLAPMEEHEQVEGEASVMQIFDMSGTKGNNATIVAGCVVGQGTMKVGEKFKLIRDGVCVHEELLDCASMRRHRLEVDSVGKGSDCGIALADVVDIRMGDVIQCVSIVRRPLRSVKVESGGSMVMK
ncbi:Translation elongation/initiation factor/Ribosomal, beta-barrel [Ostreococcus tauri]|uniref:Translation initiation factor IF-2, mitochondrial n=1 Tax=Ostreococcus tauri TaxID=70448 RepID=A0A090M407_OSTTA|nr:Translation elongation/initiation factor/Ribosomal, beta-barrel [Ostreococcus tauri]CEF98965.1 Translation elongation/initiation factor/Ribosomal, beta-barrel [Ostreococcus tauri]|eukprot:XP_022839570.1 Translation elongation/initiation factor/Ribosomal, beta-barrel [Ostreococcus tauri]